VRFARLDEVTDIVPRVEEVHFGRHTCLRFCLLNEPLREVNLRLGVLLVEPESNRISGLIVGIVGVDHVLAPEIAAFGVVVEAADVGKLLASRIGERGVNDVIAVLRPPRFVVLLELLQPLQP
jgi:hypothetical protein